MFTKSANDEFDRISDAKKTLLEESIRKKRAALQAAERRLAKRRDLVAGDIAKIEKLTDSIERAESKLDEFKTPN